MSDLKLSPQILAMYLGTQFRYRYVDWALDSWSPWTALNGRDIDKMQDLSIDKIQLQCRRLSSMTEEEAREMVRLETDKRWHSTIEICQIESYRIWYTDGSRIQGDGFDELQDLYIYFNYMTISQFQYLLSKHFDLFGLIDANLAIEKQ